MIQPKRFLSLLFLLLALYLIGHWILSGPKLSVTNITSQVSPGLFVRLGGDTVNIPPLEPNKTFTTNYDIKRDSEIKVYMDAELKSVGGYVGGTNNNFHLNITDGGVLLARH